MSDEEFEDFLRVREEAARAYVRGDGAKVDAITAQNGAASFHSPQGDTVVGAKNVAARYLADSKSFHPNGTTHFEVIQKGHDGDFGFWTGFQVAAVQIGKMPQVTNMRVRVTELFRRIDGKWRLIHRHADMPPR